MLARSYRGLLEGLKEETEEVLLGAWAQAL